MFMRKRKLASLIFTVLSLILLLAVQARAADAGNDVEKDDSGKYYDAHLSFDYMLRQYGAAQVTTGS